MAQATMDRECPYDPTALTFKVCMYVCIYVCMYVCVCVHMSEVGCGGDCCTPYVIFLDNQKYYLPPHIFGSELSCDVCVLASTYMCVFVSRIERITVGLLVGEQTTQIYLLGLI